MSGRSDRLGYFVGSTFVPFTSKRCGDGVNFSWCSFYVSLYYHVFICMHTLYAVVFYIFFRFYFYNIVLWLWTNSLLPANKIHIYKYPNIWTWKMRKTKRQRAHGNNDVEENLDEKKSTHTHTCSERREIMCRDLFAFAKSVEWNKAITITLLKW